MTERDVEAVAHMTWPDFLTARPISHVEAREVANRLIASHFRNDDREQARVSIPANPERDDDLLILAYIRQQEASTPPNESPSHDAE